MSIDIKYENKCCETCLNRASFSNGKHMCCEDLYGIPKDLPDEHICDKYSPDIANNPSLREPKSDTEISEFMNILRELENTYDIPCKDGCTCHECDYFTEQHNRFMVDGICRYYGIYLYDFVKNSACQHFKLKCCDDISSNDANSTAEHYDSYFKSFKAINADRTDEELADRYGSIVKMFKKDVENVEWGDSKNTPISDNNDKPPLGIKPPYVYASERISDICEAILRLNQESVVVDTDTIRSYASELCAICDYLDACRK